jgi:hypothetical protein
VIPKVQGEQTSLKVREIGLHPVLFTDIFNCFLQVDANVFIVDWGIGAGDGEYNKVCANIRVVGAEIAR